MAKIKTPSGSTDNRLHSKVMAATFIGEEFPLWRIHNLGTSTGATHNIVNIARPDTVALLHHLGGGNPLGATGRLLLAADYKFDPATLREATFVRIEKVFADPTGKGSLNAELFVLCKCRVKDVVTSDPFPRARRLPDLAPLWRIHGFDPLGNSLREEDINIENISRPDTLALLKALGAGEVTRATGHLVIACSFKEDLSTGLEAVLARIGKVSDGDPPLTCSLCMLGRVRCAQIETGGEGSLFPQALMEEVPVWRIHNLAASTLTKHKITNIGRPDSLAMLAYLGRGNPLAAVGGLVIGCDFKAPPGAGNSVTLMRIAVVGGVEGKYDAELVEVSSIIVGRMRTDESNASWWPRATVELPKIWSKPHLPTEVGPLPGRGSPQTPLAPSPPVGTDIQKSKLGGGGGGGCMALSPGKELRGKGTEECPFWQRCFRVMTEVFQNAGAQMQEYAEPSAHRCFCNDCHRVRGDAPVYRRGDNLYVLPVGFARIGVKPFKSPHIVKVGLESWHVCFHGTKREYLWDLLVTGHLLAPCSTIHNGQRIVVRPGHIGKGFERMNEHTGTLEVFDPTNKIFFSPSIKYCAYKGVYMTEHMTMGKRYSFALQVRIQPEMYSIGQETVGAGSEPIDPHIPNTSVEWYTHEMHTHFFTGVLIGER